MKSAIEFALCAVLLVGSAAAAVTTDELLAKVRASGLPEPTSITAPVLPNALVADALQISGVTVQGSDVWMRMRCSVTRSCRPFFLQAHYRSRREARIALDQVRSTGTLAAKSAAVVLRAGDPARLTIKIASGSVILPVRCLQRGRIGQKIRVRDG
jgi:hypothetical protein